MPASSTRVAAQYIRAHADLVKWLYARSKKAKGIVQIPTVERAFEMMPGWSIRPTKTWTLLNGNLDGHYIVAHLLASWSAKAGIRYIGGGSSTKDPFAFSFNEGVDAKLGRHLFLQEVEIVSGPAPGGPPIVGRLYATPPGDLTHQVGRWTEFMVKRIWLGVPGWEISAPDGQSIILPSPISSKGTPADPERIESFASFWTWTYKHGLAESAKAAIDRHASEDVEALEASAAERKKIEQRRIILPPIQQLLREIVDAKYQEVWAAWTDKHLQALESYMEASKGFTTNLDSYDYFEKRPYLRFYKAFIRKATEPTTYPVVRRSNYQALAKDAAEELATHLREEFVHKNAYKLSLIVRTKGNLEKGTVSQVNEGPDFGGEMLFTFKDGSRFTVRNKTVSKISQLGTYFEQFPTTFHNVRLPDGKPMGTPSEARMVEVFAVS